MIDPKDLELDGKTYVLSKFPAVQGRSIIANYSTSLIPKVGEYSTNEKTMLEILSFVAVRREDGSELRLSTRALVDNHVKDWETLARIEIAMMEYNCSFFQNGMTSKFLEGLVAKAQPWIIETLTGLSQSLSAKTKQD